MTARARTTIAGKAPRLFWMLLLISPAPSQLFSLQGTIKSVEGFRNGLGGIGERGTDLLASRRGARLLRDASRE